MTVPFYGGLGVISDGRGGNGGFMIDNSALDFASFSVPLVFHSLSLTL